MGRYQVENEFTKADTKFDWLNTFFEQVQSMDCFKGPLGSHKNYIAHIALPNCVDYSVLVKSNRENKKRSSSDKYKELRYFLNAVESLNNILDYMYFETINPDKVSRKDCDNFKRKFCARYPVLIKVAEIANAYKHCIRGYDDKKKGEFKEREDVLHARDLAMCKIYLSVGLRVGRPLVEMQYSFDGIDSEKLVGEAFRFWVDYINGKAGITEDKNKGVNRLVIKQCPNKDILHQANIYYEAAQIVKENDTTRWGKYSAPIITNLCFAIELRAGLTF